MASEYVMISAIIASLCWHFEIMFHSDSKSGCAGAYVAYAMPMSIKELQHLLPAECPNPKINLTWQSEIDGKVT